MVKIKAPKPLLEDTMDMIQMGRDRASDTHRKMVNGFDAYQARMTEAVNEEVKRSM